MRMHNAATSAARARRGRAAWLSGLSAEQTVEREYMRRGMSVAGKRWRGSRGEIDLIVRNGDAIVFIEVKKGPDFARAAERITPRQIKRIRNTAAEFLAGEPRGLGSDVRFDVALVDGAGRTEILENVFGAM